MSLTKRARSLRQNQTDVEKKLWNCLRDRQLDGHKFYRQYPIYPYYVDFICRTQKLIVELDGGQHNKQNTIDYDKKRTTYLQQKGYRVLRFWNNDVLTNIQGVIEMIRQELSLTLPATPGPSLSLKGEGK